MRISTRISGRDYGAPDTDTYHVELARQNGAVRMIFHYPSGRASSAAVVIEPEVAHAIGAALIAAARSAGYQDTVYVSGGKPRRKPTADFSLHALTAAFSSILLGEKLPLDVLDRNTRQILIPAQTKLTKTRIHMMVTKYRTLFIEPSPIQARLDELIEECTGWRPPSTQMRPRAGRRSDTRRHP